MSGEKRRRGVWVAVAIVGLLLAWWLLRPAGTNAPIAEIETAPVQERIRTAKRPERPSSEPESIPPPQHELPQPTQEPAAPASESAETFPFVVTVVRGDGTPAAGAMVVLYHDGNDVNEWSVELARQGADADGVAKLRVVSALVRAAAWLGAEAHATAELIEVKQRGAVTLRLTPALVVRGRVLRPDSAPASHADVALTAQPWFESQVGLEMTTKTDAAGRFDFPPIAVAGIDPLNPPYVAARTEDFARGFASVDLDRPDAEIAVRLEPGFTIRARFVDGEGRPLAGVVLNAWAGTQSWATSGADGRVAMVRSRCAPQLVVLRRTGEYVTNLDRDPSTITLLMVPWNAARSLGTVDGAKGDADLGDVVLVAGAPVSGRVVDAAGRPGRGVRATLSLRDVRVGVVAADVEGRFTFPEVGPDEHRVDVREWLPDDVESVARSARVDGVKGGDPELRIVLPSAFVVTLRFLAEADGGAVASNDIHVEAWRHGERRHCVETQTVGGEPEESYSFDVPGAGAYDVRLIVGGHEPHRVEDVEVVADRPTTLDVLLHKKAE